MDNYFQQHKLTEGKWYDFKIIKSTAIDEESFFVLETPLNTRMLLPQKPYLAYSFSDNQLIRCKVDKISCSGKIYIEPEHPFYKENNSYLFPLIKVISVNNLYGKITQFVVLEDKLKQLIYLPLWPDANTLLAEIKLKVIRIKKSKVFALPTFFPFNYDPNNKAWLDLKIINAFEIPSDATYYLFEDELKHWHLAPTKYFGKALLPEGFTIKSMASKSRTNSYYFLQYEHPKYPFGSHIDFDIISEKTVVTDKNKREWQISVYIDRELQNVNLPLSAKTSDNRILLQVGLIRKGKLQLTVPKLPIKKV